MSDILEEIRFAFLPDAPLAGMAEPFGSRLAETFELLRDRGIGAVVTLTEDNLLGDEFSRAGFRHMHEPIEDCEAPTPQAMDRILDFIDEALGDGLAVAVHCLEGRGRTGTVLGAWLGKKRDLTGEEAVENIYNLRHHTLITWPQRRFMVEYLKPESRHGVIAR